MAHFLVIIDTLYVLLFKHTFLLLHYISFTLASWDIDRSHFAVQGSGSRGSFSNWQDNGGSESQPSDPRPTSLSLPTTRCRGRGGRRDFRMEKQHQGRREIRGPPTKREHLRRHLPSDGGPNPRKSQLPRLAHTSLECQLHLVVTVFLSPSGVRGGDRGRRRHFEPVSLGVWKKGN